MSSGGPGRQPGERALKRQRALGLLLAGIFVIALAPYFVWLGGREAEPLAEDELLELGARVYAQNCAVCHGDRGQGHGEVAQAPALDHSEHAWHHADGQLQDIVLDGGRLMDGFRDKLTDQEIVAVIRHFQTWWRPEQLEFQQERSRAHPMRTP